MIKTVAFMYDFDETLAYNTMVDSLLSLIGIDVNLFWEKVIRFGKKKNMDYVLAYMHCILNEAKSKLSLIKN